MPSWCFRAWILACGVLGLARMAQAQYRLEASAEFWAGYASNRFLLAYGVPQWDPQRAAAGASRLGLAGLRPFRRGQLRAGSELVGLWRPSYREWALRAFAELRYSVSAQLGAWASASQNWTNAPAFRHFSALEVGLLWTPAWNWGLEGSAGWGYLPTVAAPQTALRYGIRLLVQPHPRLGLSAGWHGWGAQQTEPATLVELTLAASPKLAAIRLALEHQRWPVSVPQVRRWGRRLLLAPTREVERWSGAQVELARPLSSGWQLSLQLGASRYQGHRAQRTDALLGVGLRASGLLWSPTPTGAIRYSRTAQGVCVEVYYKGPGRLYLVGDFNGWQPNAHPLEPDRSGWWRICLPLSPGAYAFKVRCEGDPRYRWLPLPEDIERIPDGFGGENARLWVVGV
ncbi:MAG: hypothetical protein N2561_08690 [Bacteroidetes bacterium]|nr:hypothetical protein [Rhodothermia bacterium]MCS7155315.1 hypothetical protein [Bacteroidota bacterium]MCX7907592.1 hypothetical protein [Bacteroidota bacterium]MDW8138586.1 hypothetical protein [Bacteroidota bacterium]MDW8284477.1 hypothetical protein [Bacteroidota bacterium]